MPLDQAERAPLEDGPWQAVSRPIMLISFGKSRTRGLGKVSLTKKLRHGNPSDPRERNE